MFWGYHHFRKYVYISYLGHLGGEGMGTDYITMVRLPLTSPGMIHQVIKGSFQKGKCSSSHYFFREHVRFFGEYMTCLLWNLSSNPDFIWASLWSISMVVFPSVQHRLKILDEVDKLTYLRYLFFFRLCIAHRKCKQEMIKDTTKKTKVASWFVCECI